MEEILARLLAEMNAIQEKMDDGQEEMITQVGFLASRINANQEETKAMLDACLENTEENSGEQKSVAGHEEIHMETFGAVKKRHGDRHLALGRRRKQEKRTQDNGGSRKKLAAARRGMTRCAGVT
jgi:hypothetical protein